MNHPWVDFGNDFGKNFNLEAIEESFREMADGGVELNRFWIHCDGRASPSFGEDGKVTGLPETFIADLKAVLDLGSKYHIDIMPTLWSFDMVKDQSDTPSGKWSGVHRKLVNDPEYTQSYIDNALIPMVEALDDHPALWAWEICNEPEWMHQDLGEKKEDIIRFHAMIAQAIHQHAKKPVTTGSASIKWHADNINFIGEVVSEGNWWSDESLRSYVDDEAATLDFYQIHTYGWMLEWNFDLYAFTPKELGLDKPVLIGEAPGKLISKIRDHDKKLISYTVEEAIAAAHEKGYMGILFWSYDGKDGEGSWKESRQGINDWYQKQ